MFPYLEDGLIDFGCACIHNCSDLPLHGGILDFVVLEIRRRKN